MVHFAEPQFRRPGTFTIASRSLSPVTQFLTVGGSSMVTSMVTVHYLVPGSIRIETMTIESYLAASKPADNNKSVRVIKRWGHWCKVVKTIYN